MPPLAHLNLTVADLGRSEASYARWFGFDRRPGVTITDVNDEPDFVSLKCLDPDGYEIEVYWG